MELSQGQIIKKPNKQELFSLLMTHRLNVMHAPVMFHKYIPYGLGVMARTRIGADVRTYGTDGQGKHLMPFRCSSNRWGQKPNKQELSSFFTTYRLNVMHASVKFHKYIPYGLGVMARTRIGTDVRTYGTDG